MVRMDPQVFTMGCIPSPKPCPASELPVREVRLTRAWLIGVTEVRGRWYEALMGGVPVDGTLCDGPALLTWNQAVGFVNRVSELSGFGPCYWCDGAGCSVLGNSYECEGYRLPTEAEWEATARCGADFAYAGSDDLDAVAWTTYADNEDGAVHVVGQKEPNGCGTFDMSGNAAEWTQDLSPIHESPSGVEYYDPDDLIDPLGYPVGACRWARGHGTDPRVSARVPEVVGEPTYRPMTYGLRLARTVTHE